MAADPWAEFDDAPGQSAPAANDPWAEFSDAPSAASDEMSSVPLPFELASPEEQAQLRADTARQQARGPIDDALRYADKYASNVGGAIKDLATARPAGPLGGLDAGLSLATGAVSPLTGGVRHLLTGEPIEQAADAMTYRPRTESGQAQMKLLGAVAQPLQDSGADVALLPLTGQGISQAPHVRPSVARPAVLPGKPVAAARPAGEVVQNAASRGRKAGLQGVSEKAPSLEELSKAASDAYKRADDAGIVVREESLNALKSRLVTLTKKEGIDKDLHPDATAALNKVVNSEGALTLSEIETLRKVASDAKGSTKPADKRLASQITEQLDDYIDNLSDKDVMLGDAKQAKALKEARALYTRKMKAQEINDMIQRAEDKAPGYSASGKENALRREFINLASNKKRMSRFSAEEQAAIRKVAKDGRLLQQLGKFGPTDRFGQVTGLLATVGTGGVGAVLPITGLISKELATRKTMRNALAAEEIMRRGPPANRSGKIQRNALIDQ